MLKKFLFVRTATLGYVLILNSFFCSSGMSQTPTNNKEHKLNDCTSTIVKSQNVIESGRNVQVNISSKDVSQEYPDHPKNRLYSYIFLMQGAATSSIMSSPRFLQIIATRIINNCPSVAIVEFAYLDSDNFVTLGRMKNGNVEEFQCLNTGYNGKVKWGYMYCP